MKTVAIIQARMSSTRLPGKVLMTIAKKPMLSFVVDRLLKAKSIDEVVVATSRDQSDDKIVKFCQREKILYFRGDLENVLDRYFNCAREHKAQIVVRVTSDCPLIDPQVIDEGLKKFQAVRADYLSNTLERTFPRGFDFEVLSFEALSEACRSATTPEEKEHVTPFIWKNVKKQFFIEQLTQKNNQSQYRLTVDTPEDFLLLKILIEKYNAHNLGHQKISQILSQHPELVLINRHIEQKKAGQYAKH